MRVRRFAILGGVVVLGAALGGCCCTGSTLQVYAKSAKIVGHEGSDLIVELITDRELPPLERSKWAATVLLSYSVDDNQPVEISPHAKDYDLATITYTRPFIAELSDSVLMPDGNFRSKWRIPLKHRLDVSPMIYEYCLTDSKEHVLRLEVYGASYSGGYLHSNPLTLNVPAFDK